MRVRVYELQPGPAGFELDKERMHCIIDIKAGKGSFEFFDSRREKLIRSLFENPSKTFVAGGKTPDGYYVDAMKSDPAWSAEAVETVVSDVLYGFNLGATIEYDNS